MNGTEYGDIDLAPESIVAGIVAGAAFDDGPELPDVAPFAPFWRAGEDDRDETAVGVFPHTDEARPRAKQLARTDAWARHARGANGFGG